MTSHLLLLELGQVGWDFSGHGWFMRILFARPSCGKRSITVTVSTNQNVCYNHFEIQRRSVITKFHVSNMTVYMSEIYEIKNYAQVKARLAFTIESVSSCFLINYIFAIHAIVVKLDDVRKRNRSVRWILSYTHQYIAQVRLKILLEMIHSSDPWF